MVTKSQKKSSLLASESIRMSGLTYENEQEINEAIKEVRNDDNEINFCLIGYKDTNTPNVLVLKAKGSGGVEELKQHLTDDNCFYGIVRVTEMIDKSLTVKFCYIKYLGTKCKTMFKAKLTTHTSPVCFSHLFWQTSFIIIL